MSTTTTPPPSKASDEIALTGPMTLEAKAGKTRRFRIDAYSGGFIRLQQNATPFVLEVTGITPAGSKLPILTDHKGTMEANVGHTEKIALANQVVAEGPFSGSNDATQEVVNKLEQGAPLQASVGVRYRRNDIEPIGEGESRRVNGRDLAGPFTLIRKSELYEISVVPLGADSNTSVALAASAKLTGNQVPETTNDPATELARVRRQQNRLAGMADTLGLERVQELTASLLTDNLSDDEFNDLIFDDLKAKADLSQLRASRPAPPSINLAGTSPAAGAQEKFDALFLSATMGEAKAAEACGERLIQATRPMMGLPLADAWHAVNGLQASGSPASRLETASNPQTLQASAGFTTLSLPHLLGGSLNRALELHYRDTVPTYQAYSSVRATADFRKQSSLRPSFMGQMDKVAKDGEAEHSGIRETLYEWKIDSYLKALRISFQDLKNDNLGFFNEAVSAMAQMARRSVADLHAETLLGAGSEFFDPSKGNLNTSNALSYDALNTALTAFRSQRDADNNNVDIPPAVLIVPPELEEVAKAVLNSEYTERVATATDIDEIRPTGNSLRQSVSLVVEPRLSNTAKFSGASATTWYLAASPSYNAMTVGFLDGMTAPRLKVFNDADPTTLGTSWRMEFHFGVAMGDFRAIQRNTA